MTTVIIIIIIIVVIVIIVIVIIIVIIIITFALKNGNTGRVGGGLGTIHSNSCAKPRKLFKIFAPKLAVQLVQLAISVWIQNQCLISGFGIAFCCRNLFGAPDSPPCIDFMTFSIIFWRSRFWRQIACWSIHEEVEERNSDCRTAKVCGQCDVMLRLEWCGCLCDTRHASHVTRHASHVTRHASPASAAATWYVRGSPQFVQP